MVVLRLLETNIPKVLYPQRRFFGMLNEALNIQNEIKRAKIRRK
jgi:hypothetical protein